MANKVDLKENREVTSEMAKELCKEYNIIWGGECSAKENNVDELKKFFEFFTLKLYQEIGITSSRKGTSKTINTEKNKKRCVC